MEEAIYDGEWVIALSAVGKFIGKLKPDTNAPDYPSGVRLEPAYEIVIGQVQQPGGQTAMARQLMPILLISNDIGLTLGKEAATISVSALPIGERNSWFDMIKIIRMNMLRMRAQNSGIALPGH